MKKDNDPDEFIDGLLTAVVDIIDEYYERVENLREVEQLLSTEDIYEAVQQILPSGLYGPEYLAKILLDHGFSFIPIQGPAMQFAWLIKRR